MAFLSRTSWRSLAVGLACCSLAPVIRADDSCEVPAAVEDAVWTLVHITADCGRDTTCLRKAGAEWDALFAKYPQNVPLHRSYQDAWRRIDGETVARRYKELLAAHPDEPYALALYVSALPEEARDQKSDLNARALRLDPKYAWAHLELARRYTGQDREAEKDHEKAKLHILAFAETCPRRELPHTQKVGFRALEVKVHDLARGSLERLAPEVLRGYMSTWASAFRLAPEAEHAAIRERIKADVARVRAMNLERSGRWWQLLGQGYKIAGDYAAEIAVHDEILRRFPCETHAIHLARERWAKANPEPSGVTDAASWRRWNEANLQLTRGLVERCPQSDVEERRAAAAAGVKEYVLTHIKSPGTVSAMGHVLMRRLCQTKPLGNPVHEAAVNLLLAGAWLEDRFERALLPLGISHAQYNVLRILRGVHPEGHPRGEIARRMIDRAPDITRLIDRLKRRGLVERARGTEDRRTSVTRITARGLDVVAKATRAFELVHEDLGARIAARRDREALSRLCESIYGADVG